MCPKSVRCRVVVGTSGVQLFWFQKIVDRQVAQRGTARARCAPVGLARARGSCYCGSALRMAWVSSATAIRQNSNWDLVCTIPARKTVNMALLTAKKLYSAIYSVMCIAPCRKLPELCF